MTNLRNKFDETLTGRGSGEVAVASTLFASQLEHLAIRPRLCELVVFYVKFYWKKEFMNSKISRQLLYISSHLLLALTRPLDDLDLFFTGLVTMTFVALRAFGGEDI